MKFSRGDLTLLLITLLGSLSIVDVVTTTFGLQRGGRELNVFLAPFVQDPAIFLAIKALGLFIIVSLAVMSRMVMKGGDHAVLATACGMSIYPAVWNMLFLWSG